MNELDVEAIRARWADVTPGPRQYEACCRGDVVSGWHILETGLGDYAVVAPRGDTNCAQRDAEAIAHAPEDVVALIAEVERLRRRDREWAALADRMTGGKKT